MSTLSEGELHVQAMRLVCEALADREKTGLEVDWDVIGHMHDHMDVIFRGIEDQRRDDQDELMHTRKDRDHWKQARQDAIEAGELMRAELEKLRGAMAADDKRLRDAEARVWPERTLGCDAPDAMADEILHLRKQLDAAQAAVTLQRAGIERLQEVVTRCRRLVGHYISYADINSLRSALAELDAGTEPAPVAEPLDAEDGACPGK